MGVFEKSFAVVAGEMNTMRHAYGLPMLTEDDVNPPHLPPHRGAIDCH